MSESSEECWLPIAGYEGLYEISNLGRVAALRFGQTNNPGIMRLNMGRGYFGIVLRKRKQDQKRMRFTIHRLVMEAFVGPRPKDYDINHKNGNKHDNRLENLEYVTKSENQKHSFRIGLQDTHGEGHSQHKLKEQDVHDVRSMISAGISRESIASKFGVTTSCIHSIVSGRTWSHLKEGGIILSVG